MTFRPWESLDPTFGLMRMLEQTGRLMERGAGWHRQWPAAESAALQLARQYEEFRQNQQSQLKAAAVVLRDIQDLRTRQLSEIRAGIGRQVIEAMERASLNFASSEASAVWGIVADHRQVMEALAYDTIYGGSYSALSQTLSSMRFQRANERLIEGYEKVSDWLELKESASTPSPVRSRPTIEVFTSAEVVEELSITEESDGEEGSEAKTEVRQNRREIRRELHQEGKLELRQALEALDPRLIRLWEGSSAALRSTNPDRARHFAVSRRELMISVLDRLAPDEEVREWSRDPSLYQNDGRPTRTARLLFVCRIFAPFEEFVRIDHRLVSETLRLLQKTTHALEADVTLEQLEAAETRHDQHLLFLLLLGRWRR